MYTALLLLSVINYTASKWQGFKILDGHLEIMSYKDKNITLLTSGEGYVNLGYDNILEVTRKVQSASAIVDRSKKDVSEISQTLESLQEIVSEIESGILHLENTTGITLNPVSANRMILFIRVQARTIRAQIAAIKATMFKDECETNPCRNGGTCLDLYNKFYCLCPKNWEGPTCESDVNECAIFQGTDFGCQNDAICTNLQGSYKCECRDGWIGMHCKSLKRDCDLSGSEELCGHGHCFNNDGKIACLCHQGWSMDLSGQCTIDVNECASKQAVCSHDPYVECYNMPGSFHCGACPRGYSGNGYYCSDVNECEINNGGCSEFPKVQCINTPGSRVCGECPAFYTGDGINCIEETGGTCNFNNGGCHPNALCTPILGSGGKFVRCTCNFGYSGDGIGPNGCVEVDKSTLVKHGCAPGGCLNGGTCQALTPFDYECVCPPFYSGPHCDVRLRHPCDIKPCLNGGLCVEDVNSTQGQFKCLCQLGFTGSICETLSDDCFGSSNLPRGNLMFPFLHASTRPSVVCHWTISVDPEKLIQIRFNSLKLSVNTNCSSYIEIHDIRPFAKQVLIKICNSHDVAKVFLKPTTYALGIYAKLPNNEDSFRISWNSINASCTKYITINDSYLIESPGYPKNYSSNLDCYWHLEAMEGKQIEFVFYVVSIDESSKCDKDYLQVFEQSFGNSFQSLLTTCSKFKTISSVKSKTHQALLHFHSDHSGSSAGFKIGANVVAGCGKFLTHTAEEIVYPLTDGSSKGKGFCEWRIHLPIGEKVQISFDEFNLQDCQEECACQNLKIYDGSNIVGTYCGDDTPGEKLSETNTVSIVLYSQDSVDASKGFRMHYTANCGGTFKESSGEFTSPYYPNDYPDDRVCEYIIEQPEKKKIKLQVLDFDVENPSWARGTCRTDFLEIRDGIDEDANLIGSYCGGPGKIPSEIVSSFNHLYLKFSTDESQTFKGFKIAYSTIDVVCGGIFKDMQGTISSPLEDGAYPPNTVCTWIIIAPIGHIIDINFISFHLVWTYDCHSDSLEVFENSTATGEGRRLNKLCGWSTAPPITSTWNMVTLVLKTDDWLNRDGFKLNYTMINATHNCGSTFHSPSGEIRSPNYPKNYLPGVSCTWKIEAPSGQQIRLTFIDFQLEEYDFIECDKNDNLEIRDGSSENSPLIKRLCGETLPAPILSYTNKLFLKLNSDRYETFKGFHIKWDSSSTGCGGILTAPSGFITTPNFPRHYYKNSECIWKITVNHGSKIQLEFEKLVLQSHDMCKTDRLEIYDGINSAAKKLGHYCSSNHPPTLISSGNNVFIKFITDASEEYDGFQLNYRAICNTTLTGRHGIIESLNFPDFYPLDSNCFWYIIIPGGSNISIQFTHYEVNLFKNWCLDYVEILTNTNKSLKKLCGVMPNSVIIANTSVYIHFKSNTIVNHKGFRLEWFVKGCGGTLKNEDDGHFTSPGFPDPYPANVVCEWYINVPLKQAIQFSITVYHIQNSTNCIKDSLKIYGGQDDTAPLLSTLCNERITTRQVTVSGSHAFVRFTSDSSHQGKGFYISYYKTDSVCGGSIEGPSGQIISHNYPNNYEPNQYCEWNVFVQYNHVINLTFVDFDIVPSSSGGFNRVLVYDYDMSSEFTKTIFNETGRLEDLNSTSIISTTNNILIRHQSDSAMTAKGFRAVYHEACGYHSQLEYKSYFSIDYAPQDTVCVFYITTSSANSIIKLSVSSIILKPDTNISIYNGDSDDERLLLKVLNGTKAPPDILSSGPAMTIKLMNPYRQHVQFIASYSGLAEDCGGYISSEAGTIASPNFPNGYPENIECIWYIIPSLGNKVILTFSEFELDSQNDPFCNQDYVEVRDRGETGDLLGLYCKDNVPKYDTYGKGLWMKFRSDSNGTARGFVADYKLSHVATLNGRDGALQSPLYPSMYSGKGTFLWTITVPKGNQIKIGFF
uniref:Cubilin n=2 Tax=Clastoptera arizonana TaxID=38151 RepID=A0A1B6C4Q2_9HEMI